MPVSNIRGGLKHSVGAIQAARCDGGALALPVCGVLKATYCVIYRLVEKSAHEAMEFSVPMQFYGCINHAGKMNVLEKMVLDQAQRVNDFAQSNPLSKPLLPQLSVTGLNRRLGLVAEPASEVAINIIDSMMQLFTSKVMVVLVCDGYLADRR